MPKLRQPLTFETAFGKYTVDELLGQGGSGRVYGGLGPDHSAVAVKVLTGEQITSDKRSRFKNEISFLLRTEHPNLVSIVDHGVTRTNDRTEPFYVMSRFDCSLRKLVSEKLEPGRVLSLYSQILDGVEAAHMKGAIHRDLKPENILWRATLQSVAIADFGIARFTEDILATIVETSPGQRLANFQYAAPEQRSPKAQIGQAADLYALGLILNEMFTQQVPHGTNYIKISQVSSEHAFLDGIVDKLLRQQPLDRPNSVAEIKKDIMRFNSNAVALQRLNSMQSKVIRDDEVDEPLALDPPNLVSVDWSEGLLTLILDKAVNSKWLNALKSMAGYSSVLGKDPSSFRFNGNRAYIEAADYQVQAIVDHFKLWLPNASLTLKFQLEQAAQQTKAKQLNELRKQREMEERRLRVLQSVQI